MKKIIYAVLVVLTGATVSGCRNDFDFDEAHNLLSENVKKYNENFTKLYGEIDPGQKWDFSSYAITRTGEAENVSKRYMIEDLGANEATDIDFNDIVVDLIQTVSEEGEVSQKAIIRALGGTLNFKLHVGHHVIFHKYESCKNYKEMINTGWNPETQKGYKNDIDPDAELFVINIPDNAWIHSTNNIWVEMLPTIEPDKIEDYDFTTPGGLDGTPGIYAICFPEVGEVPQMIAFNTNHEWYPEKVSIKKKDNVWWGYSKNEQAPQNGTQ